MADLTPVKAAGNVAMQCRSGRRAAALETAAICTGQGNRRFARKSCFRSWCAPRYCSAAARHQRGQGLYVGVDWLMWTYDEPPFPDFDGDSVRLKIGAEFSPYLAVEAWYTVEGDADHDISAPASRWSTARFPRSRAATCRSAVATRSTACSASPAPISPPRAAASPQPTRRPTSLMESAPSSR